MPACRTFFSFREKPAELKEMRGLLLHILARFIYHYLATLGRGKKHFMFSFSVQIRNFKSGKLFYGEFMLSQDVHSCVPWARGSRILGDGSRQCEGAPSWHRGYKTKREVKHCGVMVETCTYTLILLDSNAGTVALVFGS